MRLSAIALDDMLLTEKMSYDESGFELHLNPNTSNGFLEALQCVEQNRSPSETLSSLYLSSRENKFLRILLIVKDLDLLLLRNFYGDLLAQALERTPVTLTNAALAWKEFEFTWFGRHNRPVPDWPIYVEIREGLGIYGRSAFSRTGRRLKRIGNKGLLRFFDKILGVFPRWQWAAKNSWYLGAALAEKYDDVEV